MSSEAVASEAARKRARITDDLLDAAFMHAAPRRKVPKRSEPSRSLLRLDGVQDEDFLEGHSHAVVLTAFADDMNVSGEDEVSVEDNSSAEQPAAEAVVAATEADEIEDGPADATSQQMELRLLLRKCGPFSFTLKQAKGNVRGGFEARCPYHQKNRTTMCKRFFTIQSNTSLQKQEAMHALLYWCSVAEHHERQRDHLRCKLPPLCDMPSANYLWTTLDARKSPNKPLTDEQLDAAAAGAGSSMQVPVHDAAVRSIADSSGSSSSSSSTSSSSSGSDAS
eukprot:6157697-Amphidinium_carterae.2